MCPGGALLLPAGLGPAGLPLAHRRGPEDTLVSASEESAGVSIRGEGAGVTIIGESAGSDLELGTTHSLSAVLVPPPQLAVQGDHSVQSVQTGHLAKASLILTL